MRVFAAAHAARAPPLTFASARRGGTGGIWKGVAALLPAERKHFGAGCAVTALDADARVATLASGATVSYDSLVSTMPLDILLRMLGKGDWADGLTHSSSHIIGVGIRGACVLCGRMPC